MYLLIRRDQSDYFFIALTLLMIGYLTYGKVVERIFETDDRPAPAVTWMDGVDYVAMFTWKVFLIQLLNIAGTGPIFRALMGAVFGPVPENRAGWEQGVLWGHDYRGRDRPHLGGRGESATQSVFCSHYSAPASFSGGAGVGSRKMKGRWSVCSNVVTATQR